MPAVTIRKRKSPPGNTASNGSSKSLQKAQAQLACQLSKTHLRTVLTQVQQNAQGSPSRGTGGTPPTTESFEKGLSGVAATVFMRGSQPVAAVDFATSISKAFGTRESELPSPGKGSLYDPFSWEVN